MKKILVLDELSSLNNIYFDLLHKNYEVEVSIDAKEIVPRVHRFRPDLLIVNADLPHFDAEEVCRVVKDSFQIPILLLADKESPTTIHIDGCSADEVLTKPFQKEILLNIVRQLISFTN